MEELMLTLNHAGQSGLRLCAGVLVLLTAFLLSACPNPQGGDPTPVDPGVPVQLDGEELAFKFTLPNVEWASNVSSAIAKLYYSVEGYYNDTPSKSVDLIVTPNGSTKDVTGKILGVTSGNGYVLDIQLKNSSSQVLRKAVEYFNVSPLQDVTINPVFSQSLGALVIRNWREEDNFWSRGDTSVKFYDATFNLILTVGCKEANFGESMRTNYEYLGSGRYPDGHWVLIRNIPPMTAYVRMEYYNQTGTKVLEATSGSTSITAMGVTKFQLLPEPNQSALILGSASFID
jgi:hypothetical protein